MSRHSAIDPRFGRLLRELRQQRGLSLRALAAEAHMGKSYLAALESGQKPPTFETARHLDKTLDAGGNLAALSGPSRNGLWTPDDEERLRYVAQHPRRIDTATIDSLAVVLAHQRRMEDALGSAPLVAPVTAQARQLADLVHAAPDDDRRAGLVDVASQWAHFAGWLAAATGDQTAGRAWYLRAMEWATEAGDADMMATVLSMRGHQAWTQRQLRAMVRLSRAAAWQPASVGVRAVAIQQEGRGLAMMGDGAASDSLMDQAGDLAREAAEHAETLPPWMYFYDPTYLGLQRGLADVYLHRYDQAIQRLLDNLDRMPPEIRSSDWVGWYVLQLAAAYHRAGDHEAALAALDEARGIADATSALRLGVEVRREAQVMGA